MQFICNFHHSVFFNSTNELRSGKEPLLSAWDYSVIEDIKQSSCAEKDVSIYMTLSTWKRKTCHDNKNVFAIFLVLYIVCDSRLFMLFFRY